MPNVQVNMIDSATRFTTSETGSVLTMVAQVTGLTGEVYRRAADAVSAAMAAAGPSKATDSGTLFQSNGTASFPPGATETANVTITYKTPSVDTTSPAEPQEVGPQNAELEVFTTLTSGMTDFDVNGDRIIVPYSKDGDTFTDYPATVEFLEPTTGRRFRSLEVENPEQHAETYVGTVNADLVFNESPAHTWLCVEISGRRLQMSSGLVWDVQYEFQKRHRKRPGHGNFIDDWRPWVIAKDPSTGEPFKDIVFNIASQNGLKRVQLKAAVSWLDLGLILT